MGLVTMAMFSNPNSFECSYIILQNSISQIYNFYINKSDYLISLSDNGEWICSEGAVGNNVLQSNIYSNLKVNLENIKNEVISNEFNNHQNIYTILKNLEENIKNLETYSCVYVY